MSFIIIVIINTMFIHLFIKFYSTSFEMATNSFSHLVDFSDRTLEMLSRAADNVTVFFYSQLELASCSTIGNKVRYTVRYKKTIK